MAIRITKNGLQSYEPNPIIKKKKEDEKELNKKENKINTTESDLNDPKNPYRYGNKIKEASKESALKMTRGGTRTKIIHSDYSEEAKAKRRNNQVQRPEQAQTEQAAKIAEAYSNIENETPSNIGSELTQPWYGSVESVSQSSASRGMNVQKNAEDYLRVKALGSLGIKSAGSERFNLEAENEIEAKVFAEGVATGDLLAAWVANIPILPKFAKKWINASKSFTTLPEDSQSYSIQMAKKAKTDALTHIDLMVAGGENPSDTIEFVRNYENNIKEARAKFKQMIMFNPDLAANPELVNSYLLYFNEMERDIAKKKIEAGLI